MFQVYVLTRLIFSKLSIQYRYELLITSRMYETCIRTDCWFLDLFGRYGFQLLLVDFQNRLVISTTHFSYMSFHICLCIVPRIIIGWRLQSGGELNYLSLNSLEETL